MARYADELDLFEDGQEKPPCRAVGYVRMSTSDQEASPAAQRKSIARTVKVHGLELLREFSDDGISGSIANRDGLRRLIDFCAEHDVDTLVVRDYERVSRLDTDAEMEFQRSLRMAGVQWIIGETEKHRVSNPAKALDDLPRKFRALFSHQYLQKLSFNVCDGMASQVADNITDQTKTPGWSESGQPRLMKYNGGCRPRYGYCLEKVKVGRYMYSRTVKDPKTQAVVEDIIRLALAGHPVGTIVSRLNSQGIPSALDRNWNAAGVETILTHPYYQGSFLWGDVGQGKHCRATKAGPKEVAQRARDAGQNGEPVAAKNREAFALADCHEPYVSQSQAKRLTALLSKRRNHRDKKSKRSGCLAGLLVCQHCGRPMRTIRFGDVTGYTCKRNYNGRHYCDQGGMVYEADVLPGLLNNLVATLGDAVKQLDDLNTKPRPNPGKLTKVENELDRVRHELKSQTDKLLALNSPSQTVLHALNDRIQNLQDELERLTNERERLQAKPQDDDQAAAEKWLRASSVVFQQLTFKRDGESCSVFRDERGRVPKYDPRGRTKSIRVDPAKADAMMPSELATHRRQLDALELRQLLIDLGVSARITWDKSPKKHGRKCRIVYTVEDTQSSGPTPKRATVMDRPMSGLPCRA
ncbi:MAG: recombinase family protein [Planctomycetia bacterium]|nr:recombinase family protein [Planctomycetia bacterium]